MVSRRAALRLASAAAVAVGVIAAAGLWWPLMTSLAERLSARGSLVRELSQRFNEREAPPYRLWEVLQSTEFGRQVMCDHADLRSDGACVAGWWWQNTWENAAFAAMFYLPLVIWVAACTAIPAIHAS
jgi:hypothetical protein